MITRPPEQADAERAVENYKHALAVKVKRFIVELALRQLYVFPGDVPVDIVAPEHRQGVVSNACGSLKSLEILEELPATHHNPDAGIFHGKKCNKNAGAKQRWVGVYRLCSKSLAERWIFENPIVPTPQPKPETREQMALI